MAEEKKGMDNSDLISRREALKRIAKKAVGTAGVLGGIIAASTACYLEGYDDYSDVYYYYVTYYY